MLVVMSSLFVTVKRNGMLFIEKEAKQFIFEQGYGFEIGVGPNQ